MGGPGSPPRVDQADPVIARGTGRGVVNLDALEVGAPGPRQVDSRPVDRQRSPPQQAAAAVVDEPVAEGDEPPGVEGDEAPGQRISCGFAGAEGEGNPLGPAVERPTRRPGDGT